MNTNFQLWPEQASSFAPKVDALYIFLLAVSAFFTALIFALMQGTGHLGPRQNRDSSVDQTCR